MMGFGVALGGFLGGILLATVGGQALFFYFGVGVTVVLLIVQFLRSKMLGKPVFTRS
jgi:hypothetical protein